MTDSAFFLQEKAKLKQYITELGDAPNDAFFEFIETLVDNIKDKWDNVILISGREGVGKSTFMWWGCFLFHLIYAKKNPSYKKEFTLKKNLTYTASEFNQRIKDLNHEALGMDEGTRAFYKRNSQNSAVKESVALLTQSRFKYLSYFICSPRMADTDEYLRGWRITIWIEVTDRGEAQIYYIIKEETDDAWNLKDIKKRNKRHKLFGGKGNKGEQITCPDIPPSIKFQYELLKKEVFETTNIETDSLSAPERVGILLSLFLHGLTKDSLEQYKKSVEHNEKPFSYNQIEVIIRAMGEKYEVEGVSDSTIRQMCEKTTKSKEILTNIIEKEAKTELNNTKSSDVVKISNNSGT